MGEIVLPLLSESGYVSADESTGNLLLIDTVENLMKIEAIIAQFDVPGAEKTTTQVFEMAHADPAEVVQLLRMLLSDTPGRPGGGYGGGTAAAMAAVVARLPRLFRQRQPALPGRSTGAAANSVIMGPSQLPVVLIPEPKRKWIIARASAEDMKLITEWIAKLDRGEPTGKEYETVPITYGDVREVATRINEALQQMPGTELQASVLVQALEQARQVMVFGRQDLREMVKKMIEEIDVPPGQFETRHFEIKHADPDQIKRNIDELFGEGAMVGRTSSYRSYGGYRRPQRRGLSPDTVKTISHVTLKQVTVIASPENMKKIAEQIEQWDIAVDVNTVRPRIIELRNSDPTQMATLLKTLFSQEMSSRYSFFDYLFGSSSQDKQRIIGPLYGQVTFEQVPGTKKLIVISNIPQAYGVVEDLVKELDGREAAEVPKVVRLNYADPEILAQRLNAMFNETGTTASISLTQRGLSQYSMDEGSGSSSGNNNRRNAAASNSIYNQGPAGEYRPWWTTGGRGNATQMPISNIIGRARFIPDTHSKSVLVLAPPEFMESLQAMITELDIPGKQLMLKAIIMQVDHQNMTSLGVQYSSDPSRWNPPDNENALVARNTLSALQQHGSLVIDPRTGAATGEGVRGAGGSQPLRPDRFPDAGSPRQDPQPADPVDEGQRGSPVLQGPARGIPDADLDLGHGRPCDLELHVREGRHDAAGPAEHHAGEERRHDHQRHSLAIGVGAHQHPARPDRIGYDDQHGREGRPDDHARRHALPGGQPDQEKGPLPRRFAADRRAVPSQAGTCRPTASC